MTWRRATEIVPGRTYSWWEDDPNPWVARMVDQAGGEGVVTHLDAAGRVDWARFNADKMPYEQAPVAPWIVRTEYRVPNKGELYVAPTGGVWVLIGDDHLLDPVGPVVVLIIEPNPEAAQS